MKSIFCCPVCRAPLEDWDTALKCQNGHSFDKARQGYVHLLPANKMHAKSPGDNQEMVAARRRFLESGHYQPFCDAICAALIDALGGRQAPVLVDAGCGEGYYTHAVGRALSNVCSAPVICGFDISKFAVKAAAGRSRTLNLAVASCFDIPLPNTCADALLSVFSPIVPDEFARVVKPGGTLLLAVAGERHLWGLKTLLYDAPYLNAVQDTDYTGFDFIKRVAVRTTADISGRLILDLFAMTPYFWTTPPEGSRRLQQAERLETELGFDLLLYRRKEAATP